MIFRATFANITPRALAARVQSAGMSGTTFRSYGAGDWGIEAGATVEFVASNPNAKSAVHLFVQLTLEALSEDAAYVTIDGALAFLHWKDGRKESL